MNKIGVEDDNLQPRNSEDAESPRKKMRLDNSGRKSWSLIDRRADQEVLQEMGVSLLDPEDESESGMAHKPTLKRKRDQENVNPNSKARVTSPRKNKSPLKVGSPGAGPSKIRSTEKCKPLQPSDQNALETTLVSEYLVDEETPLNQVYSGQNYVGTNAASVTSSGGRRCYTPLGLEEELILSKRCRSEPQGTDSFSVLSDEMLLSIFRWLPKRSLVHCMLVCKRWYRVACDETLWTRLDLGNKTLSRNAIGRILARKPVIVRLANSEIGEWHPTIPATPSRIQYLDLSVASTDRDTLNALLERCPHLKKLSLESVELDDRACMLIGKCNNLETLNLASAQGITDVGLTHVLEGCTGLQSLNISWSNLSEEALEVLVSKLPTRLQRLNLSGARILTDEMVSKLVSRCPRLLELDLSDCSRIGGPALQAIMGLSTLEHLALSRCYLLPPLTLTKLSSMSSLQYLEVWGMLQSASLSALRAALPAITLNQFMLSAIARPTVGTRRTSIWGLRTRD